MAPCLPGAPRFTSRLGRDPRLSDREWSCSSLEVWSKSWCGCLSRSGRAIHDRVCGPCMSVHTGAYTGTSRFGRKRWTLRSVRELRCPSTETSVARLLRRPPGASKIGTRRAAPTFARWRPLRSR